jgi:hypothetical protein
MTRLRRFVLPVIAVAALSTSACSGSAGNDSASDLNPGVAGAADGPADSLRGPVANAPAGTAFATGDSASLSEAAYAKEQATQDRAVIQTNSVSLRSDDVAKARFELDKLLAKHDGLVDNERTVTDKEGEVRMSQLVVRVPAADFDETMNGISQLGTLVESTRKAKDVTTQVIDTDVRIRAQEESLSRVETLLGRANSIRDIMAIEAQLTRRQADLDALKETRAFLSDQTEMSTVNVFIERTDVSPEPVGPTKHHNAFVAGLISGWDAFTDIGAGLAKAGGAVLPFAALLALLAWPLLLVGRRLAALSRRTTTAAAPTEA